MTDPLPTTETWQSFAARLRANLQHLTPDLEAEYLASLDAPEARALNAFWEVFAHPHQHSPDGDWTTWLLLGGRGAGKTRAGALWVKGMAQQGIGPIALIGETEHDVREVMIEGVSGLLAAHAPQERP